MDLAEPHFTVSLATTEAERIAAQRLRYAVFVEELGAGGDLVDHENRLERDRFDPYFDHLILSDARRDAGDRVVGVYRLMRADQAETAGQFYSEDEYDLAPLRADRPAASGTRAVLPASRLPRRHGDDAFVERSGALRGRP
jgi:putative hemolysin